MIKYEDVRFPIVIVSTPRSGSTALARHLQNKLSHIETFIEPERNSDDLSSFLEFFEKNKKFIVKTHNTGFNAYPPNVANYLLRNHRPYKILIERKNIAKQVLSMYVASYRDKWSYSEGNAFKKEVLPIDYNRIRNLINFYIEENKLIYQSNVVFDEKLVFEDLTFENTGLIKSPRPKNYDMLLEAMTKMYATRKKA